MKPSVLTVLTDSDPFLRLVAEPVTLYPAIPEHDLAGHFGYLQCLIEDMIATMRGLGAVGLAAPQVGHSIRLYVVTQGEKVLTFINPTIVVREGQQESTEGCLSIPGQVVTIMRSARIVVRALNRSGKPFQMSAKGRLAVAIQHEHDHLDGKLMTDVDIHPRLAST